VSSLIDTAIIGPGPYGLSVAAHLNKYSVPYRIFGQPMHSWLKMMPKGMCLKSEGFASDIYDADDSFTLEHYCRERRQPYAHVGLPVSLETFASYGLEFQRRMVPNVETVNIADLKRTPDGFELRTDQGEIVSAKRVVVASGITHFGYVPAPLSDLPPELVSHSSAYGDLGVFRGRKVAVVGAGSSAIDVAALLHEAGADVELVARRSKLSYHSPPIHRRTIKERLSNPRSTLGTGWKSLMAEQGTQVFYSMPQDFRVRVVRTFLGPSAGWFVRDMVEGKFPVHTGVTVHGAEARGNKVHLKVGENGTAREVTADHVIAGTGYRMSLRRLKFLGPEMLPQISALEDTPILSRSFESTSVPGLYFVGTISAYQFGPVTRFVCGAKFTARRLSKHLARTRA
jgi:cation diffusion facilitator CzcD-associated flavoprotein CzcO